MRKNMRYALCMEIRALFITLHNMKIWNTQYEIKPIFGTTDSVYIIEFPA